MRSSRSSTREDRAHAAGADRRFDPEMSQAATNRGRRALDGRRRSRGKQSRPERRIFGRAAAFEIAGGSAPLGVDDCLRAVELQRRCENCGCEPEVFEPLGWPKTPDWLDTDDPLVVG